MKKWGLLLIIAIIFSTVVFSYSANKKFTERHDEWTDVEYAESYFDEVLSEYNDGHFPWRNDKYEVSKEFLASNKIEDRVLGDVSAAEEKNDSYVFETEDNKKIEVHIIKPFSSAEIYFVDRYRYLNK